MKTAAKILALLSVSFCLVSCGGRQSPYKDGTSYDISFKQDGSVKATLHKITGGFNLTVTGSGRTRSFDTTSDVPWHYISKRIIDLKINEGITVLGNSLFYSLENVKGTILPSTVVAIGRDAFNDDAELYSVSTTEVDNGCNATIYIYKEDMPEQEDVYWHYKNGVPTVWSTVKVFFIGNSFTYYYDIPMIVEGMAKSLGEMIDVDYVVKGATSLKTHSDHNSESGQKIYNALMSTDDYDYVVMQEQSTVPVSSYDNFKTGATNLANDVKNSQKHAKVRLYSTWGTEEAASAQQMTIPQYEKAVRDAYIKLANEVANIDDVHFVGPAFTQIYEGDYDFPLYYTDNRHPSMYGSYLSACIHVLSIFKDINIDATDFFGTKPGQYVNQNDPTAQAPVDFGAGISEEHAKTLISIAKETVATYSIDTDDTTPD